MNSDRTLFAFLDILGYKSIIEKESAESFYKSISDVTKDLKELFKGLVPKNLESPEDFEKKCNAEIVNVIEFTLISDSIIIYLHHDDVIRISGEYYEEFDSEYAETVLFFHAVSTFILFFTSHVGFLLRGGISQGQFFSKPFGGNLLKGELLFSKALVSSYLLEQKAIHPRVLVQPELRNLWVEKVEEVSRNKLVATTQLKQDNDGEYYLDYYEIIRRYPLEMKSYFLKGVVDRVSGVLQFEAKHNKVWKKWYWFRSYHNRKILEFQKEQEQDLKDLIIK